MLIDTHCHLNFKVFKDDADVVIARALAADTWMILVGSEMNTSKRAVEYASRYPQGVYAAVGLHPTHLEPQLAEGDDYAFTTKGEIFDVEAYRELAKQPGVVAIGETGLDYYHLPEGVEVEEVKARQKKVFLEHLQLARELKLPIIIHCREAHDDLIALLNEFRRQHLELFIDDEAWGVMHCFSGDARLAQTYFDMGLYISFTGLITFARNWDELIRTMPLEKFLVETDAPYMAPVPHRGKRNEPAWVVEVARIIAGLKGIPLESVVENSTKNAKKLFKI